MPHLVLAEQMVDRAAEILLSSGVLTIFSWHFFRGIISSERSFARWRRHMHVGISDADTKAWKKTGPVSFWHPAVLVSTGVFVLPAWTTPLLAGTSLHDILIMVSVGLFLSCFTLPSLSRPELSDLRRPRVFLAKWVATSIDVAVKMLALAVVFAILSVIPYLGAGIEAIARGFFPVIGGRPGSPWFASLLEGAVLAMLLVAGLRFIALSLWGDLLVILYIISSVLTWILLQTFVNEVYMPSGSFGGMLELSLVAALPLAALREIVSASIEAMVPQDPISPRRYGDSL